VPCIRLTHLTDTQRRAYILADNKLAMNAGWDEAMLAVELGQLREEDFDLGLIGFDADAIEAMLNPPEQSGGLGDMPEAGEGGAGDGLVTCPKCGCRFDHRTT
jgi:hypothetical protein